jgi:hypothetical protein
MMPELDWIFFLALTSWPLRVSALTDANTGTIASAVAYLANLKSQVADFLIRSFLARLEQIYIRGSLHLNKCYSGNRIIRGYWSEPLGALKVQPAPT